MTSLDLVGASDSERGDRRSRSIALPRIAAAKAEQGSRIAGAVPGSGTSLEFGREPSAGTALDGRRERQRAWRPMTPERPGAASPRTRREAPVMRTLPQHCAQPEECGHSPARRRRRARGRHTFISSEALVTVGAGDGGGGDRRSRSIALPRIAAVKVEQGSRIAGRFPVPVLPWSSAGNRLREPLHDGRRERQRAWRPVTPARLDAASPRARRAAPAMRTLPRHRVWPEGPRTRERDAEGERETPARNDLVEDVRHGRRERQRARRTAMPVMPERPSIARPQAQREARAMAGGAAAPRPP